MLSEFSCVYPATARLHDDCAARLEALREERDAARAAAERLEKEAVGKVRASDDVVGLCRLNQVDP